VTMVPIRPGSWEAPMKAIDRGRKRESRWRRLRRSTEKRGSVSDERGAMTPA